MATRSYRFYTKITLALFLMLFAFTTSCFAISGQQIETRIHDTGITAKIYTKYTTTGKLNPFDIKISTTNGVVTLKGTVENQKDYETAIILAESTEGVSNVDATNLKIKNYQSPLNDLYITAKIKGALLKNKLFKTSNYKVWGIDITTENGVVTLSGTVNNLQQMQNIIDTAKAIDGVKSVNSNLIVKQ